MKRWRNYIIGICSIAVAGLVGAAAFFFWPHSLPQVQASKSQPTGSELIARGEYLTVAADCAACHTTKSGKPFAGGLAFKLPFGTIYSPNITPDKTAGIGDWTDAEFVRAMRSGVGKHGEDLYPAFPYSSYALLSTDDILAIKAYLMTLASVADPAPENSLAFPFNQRPLMRGWKFLFVPSGPFQPDPGKDKQWNDGAYLVEALAHCGECHTPRGLMFQRKQGVGLSGGDVDGWKAWNITSDKDYGLGNWSDEQIADMLTAGHAKDRGVAAGPMREAIDLSLSKLPKSDIDAIVAYLRTVPAVSGDADHKAARRKEEKLTAGSTSTSASCEQDNQDRPDNGGERQDPFRNPVADMPGLFSGAPGVSETRKSQNHAEIRRRRSGGHTGDPARVQLLWIGLKSRRIDCHFTPLKDLGDGHRHLCLGDRSIAA